MDCGDCIPSSKMPYTLRDRGTNYWLMGHDSIQTEMRIESATYTARMNVYDQIKRKCTNDVALTAYIENREKTAERFYKAKDSRRSMLEDFEKEREACGGETYIYRLTYDKPTRLEGETNILKDEYGMLILSRGHVVKTMVEFYEYQ